MRDGGSEHYTGDLLSDDQWKRLRGELLHGFDFDATMLRIAAMNLLLHGVDSPAIHYQDTMSASFEERFPEAARKASILSLQTRPLKEALDEEDVNSALLRKVKTKKTELFFIVLILTLLKTAEGLPRSSRMEFYLALLAAIKPLGSC